MKQTKPIRTALILGLTLGLVLVFSSPISRPAVASAAGLTQETDDGCLSCHANQGILQSMAVEPEAEGPVDLEECCAVKLPPLQAWEKVLVTDQDFLASIHNIQGCLGCHSAGEEAVDLGGPHEGVMRDPSQDPEEACGGCHSTEVKLAATGLHQTLTGYRSALEQRGADFDDPHMQEAFDKHCDTCHASCGQCHVSRPNYTDGGLISGHEMQEFPPVKETCMACHGVRVANEYTGKNEGVPGSVHWLEGSMACYDCHQASQFHGEGAEASHLNRYECPESPQCLDCHNSTDPEWANIVEHILHRESVACGVCHVSGPYKNCYGCHVATDEMGQPYYTTKESQMQFKIGHNPLKSSERPWDYVLVRHIPVEPDTFAFYGPMLLSEFDNAPTWKYATPHNIQRITPQNETCNNCHGKPELFLTADDVRPARWEANADVMVDKDEIPPRTHVDMFGYEPTGECAEMAEDATHILPGGCNPQLCTACHPSAPEGGWELTNENVHTLYSLVEPMGEAIACLDCHSSEGNFDWATEGYSEEDQQEYIWSEFPEIQSAAQSSSGPVWLVGLGMAIVAAIAVPFVLPRKEGE